MYTGSFSVTRVVVYVLSNDEILDFDTFCRLSCLVLRERTGPKGTPYRHVL